MVAPIALEICKKLKTNPVPFIIAIAVSSNLQGAATLVGDTTAIMLGGEMGLSFMDFFIYKGKPGMFFAVELGAVISALILYFLFRKEKGKIEKSAERTKVTDFVPSYLLIVMLVLLIAVSFIDLPQGFIKDNVNGLLCCALLVIGLVYTFIKNKTASSVIEPLKTIDLETLGILLGLFLMIGGLKSQGVIDMIGQALASIGANNTFLLYTVL